jgi:hypothetical protein
MIYRLVRKDRAFIRCCGGAGFPATMSSGVWRRLLTVMLGVKNAHPPEEPGIRAPRKSGALSRAGSAVAVECIARSPDKVSARHNFSWYALIARFVPAIRAILKS